MKKFRTTIILSVILICFSGFMLGKCSESMYGGAEFESSIYTYILNALIFICFVLVEKNTPLSYFAENKLSYFAENNLAKLVRIHSRRKALFYDIVRIFITVLFLEMFETISVLAGSVFYGRKIIYKSLVVYFVLNYIIKLFLILLQYMLEISIAYNFSFLIVYAIFICGLYSGGDIYERMLSVSDVSEQKLYERLNKFNLANYTSLSRIKDMSGNVLWTTMCVLAMIIVVIGVLCVYIKKADLLKKD